MKKVPEGFYTTSVKLGHPVAIEPEGGGAASDGNGNWETMGWVRAARTTVLGARRVPVRRMHLTG